MADKYKKRHANQANVGRHAWKIRGMSAELAWCRSLCCTASAWWSDTTSMTNLIEIVKPVYRNAATRAINKINEMMTYSGTSRLRLSGNSTRLSAFKTAYRRIQPCFLRLPLFGT